ncbi:MAG TPA: zinc ribbon-containing protein [Methylophaga sp.]|nr:zinc ribbon-containing protein [Methylophaga sp.]
MNEPKLDEKLIAAYDRMMTRVHEFLDKAESEALPTLKQRIELARQRAVELREVTSEEADKVAAYVERDLHDAAEYLQRSGSEFSTWLQFDLQQIENRMFELFAKVADRTRVELDKLAIQARSAQQYHTGEITGIGTLYCADCNTQIHFKKTGRIPPCPKCHLTEFKRRPS